MASTAAHTLAAVALLALVAGCSSSGDPQQPPPAPAELVFLGGRVYTVDADRSSAEALAVREGRIVFVGDERGARLHVGPDTRVIELDDELVLPGFHDSHVHLIEGGIALELCNLAGLETAEAIFDHIAGCVRDDPGSGWLVGFGWSLLAFPSTGPSRLDLDRLVPDQPAYLVSDEGHSAWLNSAGLAAAGITAATPDPPSGRIERDPVTGTPSGTLRETAMALAEDLAFDTVSAATGLRGLQRALTMASSFGITSAVDARSDRPLTDLAYWFAQKPGSRPPSHHRLHAARPHRGGRSPSRAPPPPTGRPREPRPDHGGQALPRRGQRDGNRRAARPVPRRRGPAHHPPTAC